jgi:hypothetical protein
MSAVKIKAALETALNSMTALATAWENTPYTPVTGTAYQQVNILFAEPDNIEFGSRHRELGYMQIKLMYPLLNGSVNAITRAELIRTTFFRGASFASGGVTVIIDRTPEISAGSVEGDRWAIPVKIRFFSNVS